MTPCSSGNSPQFLPGTPALYAYCDKLAFSNELKIVCLAQLKSFEIKFGIIHNLPSVDYEKENWELFWQTYNLVQFHKIKVEDEVQSPSIEFILENFRPELHELVRKLVSKKIEINQEYDFDLVEDDLIVAQAELGSESNKFVLYPFDEESRTKFIQKGYTEYTIENFKL